MQERRGGNGSKGRKELKNRDEREGKYALIPT